MIRGLERQGVFLALREKKDGSSRVEFFLARVFSVKYQGLPVCDIADGDPIATEVTVSDVVEMLGQPTHYFIGSTERCWLMTAQGFARFNPASKLGRSIAGSGAQIPESGWFAPLPPAGSPALAPHAPREVGTKSANGRGMLTGHIDFK